ncbi:hypothetical protein Tco_0280577 [Tanacetum coccineum]
MSWKPCQGDSLNLPDHRIHKDGDGDASFQLKSDSLPHAHAQSTKTFYKHQDSRIMKAQELKTKTSAQTLIYKIFLQRYQVYQGRLLASFQDDAKYEHVGQDTRSQGGKDDQDKQGKDLKISDIKTKSKDNDKGSRSKITKHEGTSLQRIQRPRPQDLNDKSNLIDLMKECHNELTSGEIVSLKILSRTRNANQASTKGIRPTVAANTMPVVLPCQVVYFFSIAAFMCLPGYVADATCSTLRYHAPPTLIRKSSHTESWRGGTPEVSLHPHHHILGVIEAFLCNSSLSRPTSRSAGTLRLKWSLNSGTDLKFRNELSHINMGSKGK